MVMVMMVASRTTRTEVARGASRALLEILFGELGLVEAGRLRGLLLLLCLLLQLRRISVLQLVVGSRCL